MVLFVIAADNRCTEGNIIFDDNIFKIDRLSDNIYALAARTSTDCDFQTHLFEFQLELLKLNQDRPLRVATAVRKIEQHLFRYQGYIGAYLIIVCVDVTGSHIATVHPHGSMTFSPFIASGSGGYTSLSVIEDRFKENVNILVRDALYASITTDLYSGSKINMFILTKEKLDTFLPYEIVAVRGDKQADYTLTKGTTKILSRNVTKIEFDIVNEKVKTRRTGTNEAMELV